MSGKIGQLFRRGDDADEFAHFAPWRPQGASFRWRRTDRSYSGTAAQHPDGIDADRLPLVRVRS